VADLFDHIEDAEKAQKVADPAAVLTDDQLEEGGLRQVRAFVRTRASKNAMRVQKHRDKVGAEGLKQVNVVAPEPARDVVKEIAKRTTSGEPLADVLRDVAHQTAPVVPPADAQVLAAARAAGLRGWLIRRLAGVE
jgi:hypothetical protein